MFGNHQKETNSAATSELNSIEEAIEAIRNGEVIIVVDDEDRENEGDFICAAECINAEIVNFMATHGRGLICAPLDEDRANELGLEMMVSSNTALHETAFTISIDLIGKGVTTGISAYDRSECIKALVDKNTRPDDFAKPGHIFPLKAKGGGVLRRTGHTEAAVDLAKLAGYEPAGVLVEILNEDGTMARLPQLLEISRKHNLKIISIKDLVEYRMRNERLVKEVFRKTYRSPAGDIDIHGFEQITTGDLHLAVKYGSWEENEDVLVRVHSAKETGDIYGLLFDGYGQLISRSMTEILKAGSGLFLYMNHQSSDLESLFDQYGKNQPLDQRDFGLGAQILREMRIQKIRLLTNNPKRRIGLIGYGLEITENVELKTEGIK